MLRDRTETQTGEDCRVTRLATRWSKAPVRYSLTCYLPTFPHPLPLCWSLSTPRCLRLRRTSAEPRWALWAWAVHSRQAHRAWAFHSSWPALGLSASQANLASHHPLGRECIETKASNHHQAILPGSYFPLGVGKGVFCYIVLQ